MYAEVSAGDTLTISTGGRKEAVTVAMVGTSGANGTRVGLAAPLRLDHASGVDVSVAGTGIGFSETPLKFAHGASSQVGRHRHDADLGAHARACQRGANHR